MCKPVIAVSVCLRERTRIATWEYLIRHKCGNLRITLLYGLLLESCRDA